MGKRLLAAALVWAATPFVLGAVVYPDPERFRGAIDASLAAEAQAPPPKGAIVATGSSSMRGWHRRIAADLAPLQMVLRRFGGSNMADDWEGSCFRVLLGCAARSTTLR